MSKIVYISLLLAALPLMSLKAQDSLSISEESSNAHTLAFKGQLSAWALYNGGLDLPVYTGGRYIPQLNYEYNFGNSQKLDFEASLNLNGLMGFNSDSLDHDGTLKPYRLWARYSGEQFEIRAGLQKINFGSANMIRPLMWFDGVDPRDPLNLTDGVWGLLGRYYFLNNANLWLWVLYGNENPRGWDLLGSRSDLPEFGGRFQSPVPRGEAALSYHHRNSDTQDYTASLPLYDRIPENRIGLDLRFDIFVGLWAEASWIHSGENLGMYTNQELLNLGVDYTFGVGSGLYVVYEQLLASYDTEAFGLENTFTFSLLSMSYPLGLFGNINAIMYYDWTNKDLYNFLNIGYDFRHTSLYLMAYANPTDYNIPTQQADINLFGGRGIQILLVFNH